MGYVALGCIPAEYEDRKDECRAVGAGMPISSLDEENLAYFYRDYLTNVRTRNGNPLTEQSIISGMRNFRVIMYYAMDLKLITKRDITVKTVEPAPKETFTKEEIWRLTHRKPNKDDIVEYRNWVMINYFLATGNRIGSVLALNVEDVDFEHNEISVKFTKTRTPQILALTSRIKTILSQWIHDYRTDPDTKNPYFGEPLFPNRTGERLTYEGASDSMEDYFERHYVEWKGFHKFRHSYAANWMRDGGDSLKLKTQLGHTSLLMTNRYANLYGKAVMKDAEAHSLINEVVTNKGRKQLKRNKD
jgi:integrase/recombinase XerD